MKQRKVGIWVSLSVAIAIVAIAFVLASLQAVAAPASDFRYEIANGEVKITGYLGAGGSFAIPAQIEGYPVTAITNGAFLGNKTITGVTLPSGVKAIEGQIFNGAANLAAVTFGEGVESIASWSFADCKMSSLSFPASLKTLGESSFYNCELLASATFAGDAPQTDGQPFIWMAKDFVIYYPAGAQGWTNPWNGYETRPIGGDPTDPTDPTEPGNSGVLVPPQAYANPKDAYEAFFNMRLTYFAPSTEALIEARFGKDLRFEEGAFWHYDSYHSRAVGFATNLPTIALIEYGPTSEYGQATAQSDSYYYQHLFHLTGLEPGQTYHYRILTQGFDGATLASEDATFTTLPLTEDVVRIPDDFAGQAPPYVLTKNDTKYVLTQDLNVPTRAITIQANGVEIDLNGHTISYDNGTPVNDHAHWNQYIYQDDTTFGIKLGRGAFTHFANAKVFNGSVVQGSYGGTGNIGHGFNPLYIRGAAGAEIAGVTVDYYGDSVSGILVESGKVHHNVVIDRGTVIDNRHQGILAIELGTQPEATEASYNSIRRFRHQGIMGGGSKLYNEVYSDSYDSNSYLIGIGTNCRVEGNKIFGLGYNPVGTSAGSEAVCKDNFIYIHAYAPTVRSQEYARISAVGGMRSTIYDSATQSFVNCLYEGNTVILKAWKGAGGARGIWTSTDASAKNIVYRNNTVKVEVMEDFDYGSTAGSFCAVEINSNQEHVTANAPTVFFDNTLIGNVNLINIGSSYGMGGNAHFYRTRLEKIDHHSDQFQPVRLGFWYYSTRNNRLIDTIPGTGIDLNKMPRFIGSDGYQQVSFGVGKRVAFLDGQGAPLASQTISVRIDGQDPFALTTDAQGNANFDLLQFQYVKDGTAAATRQPFQTYTFSLPGYQDATIATADLEAGSTITLQK